MTNPTAPRQLLLLIEVKLTLFRRIANTLQRQFVFVQKRDARFDSLIRLKRGTSPKTFLYRWHLSRISVYKSIYYSNLLLKVGRLN